MRPRFGSLAKNAVFTSGEWRDRVRDLAAFAFVSAALDAHSDELGRAFAVAHDRLRETCARRRRCTLAGRRRAARLVDDRGAGARPVAMTTKESLVDVSPSTVMQLKELVGGLATSRCSSAGARPRRRWRRSRASSPCSAGSFRRPCDAGHRDGAAAESRSAPKPPSARCRSS